MRLLKLFLITVALVGIVALCGCTSSNENATAKTINGEEVIKTQEVKKSAFSNTVKVRVGRQEFEISKEDYDALVNNKVPDWVVDKIQRDTGLPRDKIIEGISKKGAVYMLIPSVIDCENGVSGLKYDYDSKEFKKGGASIGPIAIPINKNAFFEFCYLNGANDVYLNESKYAKQYEQFLKVGAEAEKWFNATVKGKLLVNCPTVGVYSKDIPDSLDVYLLKNGWAFIPKGQIDYDGLTPINPYENEKDKYPLSYKYCQKRIEAEKYAQEHKLGIWAIEFPKNEN